jgi:hypothetical protein
MIERGVPIALKMKTLIKKASLKIIVSNRKTKKRIYTQNLSIKIPRGYECFKNCYKVTNYDGISIFGLFNDYLSNKIN